MIEIFKLLLKGLLTILISPILLLIYCICLIIALFGHLIKEIIDLINFFLGKNKSEYDEETTKLIEYQKLLIERNNPINQILDSSKEENNNVL